MECFVTSTSPFFQIATRAITELTNQQRYDIVYEKTSTIIRVRSGNNQNSLIFDNPHGLARRLCVCARICMAFSTGINPRLRHVENCFDRNLDDQENFTTQLIVGEEENVEVDGAQERRYFNEYDRLYPQHEIQDRIEAAQAEHHEEVINIPQTMYIFRNNWSEVIQISTTMTIQDQGAQIENDNPNEGRYNCSIEVVTTRATIAEPAEGAQNQVSMRLLIALANAHNPPNDNNMLDELTANLAKVKL